MLVLSRKKSREVLLIKGDEVIATVVVAEIRGDKVRLGFDANDDIVIHRREVYEAIKRSTEGNDERLPSHGEERKPSSFRLGEPPSPTDASSQQADRQAS